MNLKSAGWAGNSEVDVVVLSSKCVGQGSSLETQARLLCYSLEAEFLLQETSVFGLNAFN